MTNRRRLDKEKTNYKTNIKEKQAGDSGKIKYRKISH